MGGGRNYKKTLSVHCCGNRQLQVLLVKWFFSLGNRIKIGLSSGKTQGHIFSLVVCREGHKPRRDPKFCHANHPVHGLWAEGYSYESILAISYCVLYSRFCGSCQWFLWQIHWCQSVNHPSDWGCSSVVLLRQVHTSHPCIHSGPMPFSKVFRRVMLSKHWAAQSIFPP